MRLPYNLYLFFAGGLAALVGHQGMLSLLNYIKFTDRIPYAFTATKPFGVPLLISLSFWAGLWGIIYGSLEKKLVHRFKHRWLSAIVFGIFPITAINLFIVLPLQGKPFAGGWKIQVILTSILVNIGWTIVMTLFLFKKPSKFLTAMPQENKIDK